jgi:hypothetical protein
VLAREERDRFRCEPSFGFPGSTAEALFRGSDVVEQQHEFLDLG